MQRVHIFIGGDVIGIGFRFFIQRHANLLGIKGWVKNTNNKVEAVFEGSEEDIKKMLELCKEGPSLSYVKDIKIKKEQLENLINFEVK